MSGEHWFDTLHRKLVRNAPRRAVLRSATAVAAGLLLGAPAAEAAKKKPKRCGKAACEATFTTPEDIGFCEVKCGRCKRAGTKFCIHGPDEEHPARHATCCPDGQTCCTLASGIGECCDPDKCCDTSEGRFCAPSGGSCCPDDPNGYYCEQGQRCCPGVGCVEGGECPCPDGQGATAHGSVRAAGRDECGDECPTGQELCAGVCVDTKSDPANCGRCFEHCWPGEICVDGECRCPDGLTLCRSGRGFFCFDTQTDERHCGGCDQRCGAGTATCCGGACVDRWTDPNNCGRCGNACPASHPACCEGRCYNPADGRCCGPFNLCDIEEFCCVEGCCRQ